MLWPLYSPHLPPPPPPPLFLFVEQGDSDLSVKIYWCHKVFLHFSLATSQTLMTISRETTCGWFHNKLVQLYSKIKEVWGWRYYFPKTTSWWFYQLPFSCSKTFKLNGHNFYTKIILFVLKKFSQLDQSPKLLNRGLPMTSMWPFWGQTWKMGPKYFVCLWYIAWNMSMVGFRCIYLLCL